MAARPAPRSVVDAEGTTWTVAEAYQLTVGGKATVDHILSVLWFETATGRAASAFVPHGSLAILTDEDLIELLRVGTARRGRQP